MASLRIQRYFTKEGISPYDEITWETRTASVGRPGEEPVFIQEGVEVPDFWSQQATNIVAQKYFAYGMDDDRREYSVRQLIERVVATISLAGTEKGYFIDDEEEMFADELRYILLHQLAAFNSPVWFNVGVEGAKPQTSACFILAVDDSLESIAQWYTEEMKIFQRGSGAGVNVSNLRGSVEPLSLGGFSSGPVTFMRAADASAGTIQSGGTCLAPWQLVLTEKGPVPVKDLGEFVALSFHPPSGHYQAKTARAFASGEKEIVRVHTDKGHFDFSGDHPLRLASGEFVPAGGLRQGQLLMACLIDEAVSSTHESLPNSSMSAAVGEQKVHRVEKMGIEKVYDVEVDCPTLDDKSPQTGHNFVVWPSGGLSGIVVANTRRAAKMVVMDVDHPDVEDFIWCKAHEEDRVRALRSAGFAMGIDGGAGEKNMAEATSYQNANNSVRLSDDFLRAVEKDLDWDLLARRDGSITKTVKARELMRQISRAAHKCADPGVQYDTTINNWHTTPAQGAITASNPCFPARARVSTEKGMIRFDELLDRITAGEEIRVWAAAEPSGREGKFVLSTPTAIAGDRTAAVVNLLLSDGRVLPCTAQHRIWTKNRGFVEAAQLSGADLITIQGEEPVTLVRRDEGGEGERVFNLTEPLHHAYVVEGVVVANCSEYMSNDNSACNLASLNLLRFLSDDDSFDVAAFSHVTRIIFTAQEITIAFGHFPTRKITRNTRALRQIGIGYANLGALLMALGLPYDSKEGRELAGSITALLTGESYLQSTHLAERIEPFTHWAENREAALSVLAKHRAASRKLTKVSDRAKPIVKAAKASWDLALERADEFGLRNAQSSVLAPTGTISFLMDCDTTGIEPDFSLIKYKTLSGGGSMIIVNQTVSRALINLNYEHGQIEEIISYLTEDVDKGGGFEGPRGTVVGAPHLDPEHYPVFDCAVGERAIEPMGHVHMMAACQPFLSGAISKTINMPESATIEDIEEVYLEGGRLGLKAIAVYRDNCKAFQPLGDAKQKIDRDEEVEEAIEQRVTSLLGDGLLRGERRRVPREAEVVGVHFTIGQTSGYIHARLFEDGRPGAIFIDVGQAGSTLRGFINALAITMSVALQHGTPLDIIVSKLANMQFEPYGITDDPQIRQARSLVDYFVKWLGVQFLDPEVHPALGINISQPVPDGGGLAPVVKVHAKTLPANAKKDELKITASSTPLCSVCGSLTVKTGSCFTCPACGTSGGCG